MGDSSKLHPTPSRSMVATTSSPLKKQAKGRWFISCVIGSFLGFIGYTLWNELGRYQAFGEIEGTIIHVAPFAAGRITSVEVDEGDYVQAGQLLAVVDARELQMNLQKLRGEFQIALSNLSVRIAEVRERSQTLASEHTDRRAEYFKLLGDFHDKQAKLEELSRTFEANQSLRQSNSVSTNEFLASKSAHEGLKLQIADLQSAISTLEPIVNGHVENFESELLQTEQSGVNAIQSELAELQRLLDASRIVAPVAGRIIKRNCHPGEYVAPSQPMLELLKAGSVKGIVYLPQPKARLLKVGDTVAMEIVPLGKRQVFRVERISPELSRAPAALQSNYRAFKGLARVHTIPLEEIVDQSTRARHAASDLSSWIGAELVLPRFFFRVAAQPTSDLALQRQSKLPTSHEGL
jgi:multidrug resistance efflux pump